MNDDPSRIAGEVVRRCVDAPQSDAEHAIARRRLVDRVSAPRTARATRRTTIAFAAAFCIVVGIASWAVVRSPEGPPVTYTVSAGSADAEAGTYFAPGGVEPVVLRFAEGSRIQLEPSSRARVARTTARGASLVLETGTARLEIEPRPGADWRVIAGPYTVLVQGTAFSVSWDAPTGTFEVNMDRGAVLVRGPGIEEGVELTGTQHFVVRDPSRGPLPSASLAPADPVPASSAHDRAPVEPSLTAASSAEPPPKPVRLSSHASADAAVLNRTGPDDESEADPWPALAARGEYRRIVDEAEARGIDVVIQSAGLSELWAFADAARVTGQGGNARRALLAVRSRFPGGARAASAAFLLGRMADDGGNAAGALQWYERYLAEAPGGAFAPEAQGRRMVALNRSGNPEAARRAAQAYLKQYPNGPYAAVARDMLAR